MLTLITPTGDRPEAFALCERWISRQTFSSDFRWLVVDDGLLPTPMHFNQILFRLEHRLAANTQLPNMNLLLSQCSPDDNILVIEDDDYYGPRYLELMAKHFAESKAELIGEIPSRYFHVRNRAYRMFENTEHASLCQTGFRGCLIPALQQICNEGRWLDIALWQIGVPKALFPQDGQVVGVKGMPGRPGISGHHTRMGGKWHDDPDLSRLRQWIGNDAEAYARYLS